MVLVSLTITTALGIISFGTVPPAFAVEPGRFARNWVGAMHALLIEINTEATPAGSRTVMLLERDRVLVPEVQGVLVHSVYEDPRTHALLISWLQDRSNDLTHPTAT